MGAAMTQHNAEDAAVRFDDLPVVHSLSIYQLDREASIKRATEIAHYFEAAKQRWVAVGAASRQGEIDRLKIAVRELANQVEKWHGVTIAVDDARLLLL
jgi:hypothetical protein